MSKTHDAIPIPEIELYARPLGKLKFTCPNCSQDHPFKMINWRQLTVQCIRCHTKYQLGVGFSTILTAEAFLMGKWNSYVCNRLNPTGTHYDGIKIYGQLEFQCPSCSFPQTGFCKHDGRIECSNCGKPYFISALVYRLPKVSRLKVKAPFDSIVKGLNNETQTVQPISAETPSPRPGAPSSSPRGTS